MAKRKKSRRSVPHRAPPAKRTPTSTEAPVPRDSVPVIPTWLTPIVVVLACGFVFCEMKPELLFASTTPTGADLGGHVGGPVQLQALLPRLSGWSPQWFGGFPAYILYMP